MQIETLDWLRTAEGARLLVDATRAWAEHAGDPVRVAAVVRRLEPDAEKAAAATTQAQLRAKAVAKFGEAAHRMFFTPDALEQSTRRARRRPPGGTGGRRDPRRQRHRPRLRHRRRPPRLRAGRARRGRGRPRPGAGGDGPRQPEALGLAGAVQVGDATTIDAAAFDVAFADPARRGGRGRVFDVEGWTPPWPWVLDLLTHRSLVKVAPGIDHDLVPSGVEAEWVSDGGEVKEAVLWSPALATTDRRATVIGEHGLATLTDEDSPADGQPGTDVRAVGAYLYEPDGAVIRAGLVTAVAAGVGGGLVDPHIAYVTSDALVPYAVRARLPRCVEQLPYREKPLRAALHERGIGRLTIKKRGVQVVPEELRKRLALRGDNEATLVLTRVSGQGTALLVDPF